MQLLNCQVALAGDLNNKGVKVGITPAEIHVLRVIHGFGSISDVEVTGKLRQGEYSHEELYAEIKRKYPIYEGEIQAYWRDNGAKFPIDVRDLDLPEGAFRMPLDMMIERVNGATEEPKAAARGRKGKAAEPAPTPTPIESFEDDLPPEEE
jgi:hypothetical protein